MTSQNFRFFSFGYCVDVLLAIASMWLALSYSFGFDLHKAPPFGTVAALIAFGFCIGLSLVVFRLNQTVWRWTTADDLSRLAQACLVALVGSVTILFFADPTATIPRTTPVMSAVIAFALAAGARGLMRALSGGGLAALFRSVAPDAFATILVGPTEDVTNAIHTARKRGPLPIRPIAIVSPSGEHVGKIFAGAKVFGGLESLEPLVVDALARNPIVRIALVGQDPQRKAAQMALMVSGRNGVELMRIANGSGATLGAVHPGDVLGRTKRDLDLRGPRAMVRFKRVLVTGAGGTIGSEIVRQIAKLGPAQIILVDSSENNLYQISTQIMSENPGLDVVARLCDVRNEARINAMFAKFKPNVVVHAAANKHVPMMEAHFCEALEVNLGGTCVVAEAALSVGVESFVFISTDKAVNSVNIMGAAKRVSELYVHDCANRAQGSFHSVRFGNVLGSSGSVMPLFESQIAKGGPVTVTHSEMTRWFMTVEEAAALVLQAAALGASAKDQFKGGQFVLDMGEPVRIVGLAETMIRMKGKEPWRDIAIIETGMRPGERLHEELFHSFENTTETEIEGVMLANDTNKPPENLRGLVEKLLEASRADKESAALMWLQRILPNFGRAEPAVSTYVPNHAQRSGPDLTAS